MKLNYKRTVLVGFAFFLISAFWQAYDTIVPKILTERFGISQTASGFIMALDNILALFMLPLFGVISDKCKSRLGRRTPFILIGTILAACTFISLSFVDSAQLKKIESVTDLDSTAVREIIYDYDFKEPVLDPMGEEFFPQEVFTKEEFLNIPTLDENDKATDDYTNYVVPARQAYIYREITSNDPSSLIAFIAVLFMLLLFMATFRTPAVSLMPDVTPKPLRSKGNAIINLMGTLGGSLILGVGILLGTGNVLNTFMGYTPYFIIVGGIMLACLTAFMCTVREKRFVADMERESAELGIDNGGPDEELKHSGSRKLSRAEFRSLILILSSVVLWFFGYNAVTSKYSVYAGQVLNLDYNTTLLVANVAALIAFLPVGIISSKVGRKKSIMAGVIMLGTAFFVASFLRNGTPLAVMTAIFVLAGVGWATINVNSFPMVVELARGSDVGKYTGFYYTASMAAQTLTPVLSGLVMDNMGMGMLFPYATVFVGLALVTMLFVKHGDSVKSRG